MSKKTRPSRDSKMARSSSRALTARNFSSSSSRTRNKDLADPVYGGNKDMAGWKMIGFPGTHYDYRDWIDRHNQRVTLPTVSIGKLVAVTVKT